MKKEKEKKGIMVELRVKVLKDLLSQLKEVSLKANELIEEKKEYYKDKEEKFSLDYEIPWILKDYLGDKEGRERIEKELIQIHTEHEIVVPVHLWQLGALTDLERKTGLSVNTIMNYLLVNQIKLLNDVLYIHNLKRD